MDNTAWLIDGPLTKAELARRAHYAASAGSEGVVGSGDLRVTPLAVPGNGIRIGPGTVNVLNRYTNPVNQSYVASNPATETIPPTAMPAANAAARSHLVVVTVGDPQYTAAGHPWMPASPIPDADRDTFQYVRPHILANVPASTTRYDQLAGANYPGYALARIDVPANTTTITAAMIVDLRKTAQPRYDIVQWNVDAAAADQLVTAAGVYEVWPDNSGKSVYIPTWATKCYVTGYIEGFRKVNAGMARCRMRVGSAAANLWTVSSKFGDEVIGRANIHLGGQFSIPSALRGTTQVFGTFGSCDDVASQSRLLTDSATTLGVQMRFVEEAD